MVGSESWMHGEDRKGSPFGADDGVGLPLEEEEEEEQEEEKEIRPLGVCHMLRPSAYSRPDIILI